MVIRLFSPLEVLPILLEETEFSFVFTNDVSVARSLDLALFINLEPKRTGSRLTGAMVLLGEFGIN